MNNRKVAEELVKLAKKLTGGTWALPKNDQDVKKIVDAVKKLEKGDDPTGNGDGPINNHLSQLLGDDGLFDEMGNAYEEYLKKCAKAIKKVVKQKASQSEDDFPNVKHFNSLQRLNRQL